MTITYPILYQGGTMKTRSTDITAPIREQVEEVEAGVFAALDVLGIDLDDRVVSIRDWTNEHTAGAPPDLRGGTLTIRYLIKTED